MSFSTRSFGKIALCLFIAATRAFAPPFAPLHDHFELIIPTAPGEYVAYSVILVVPTDLSDPLTAVPQLPLRRQVEFFRRSQVEDRNAVLEEQFRVEEALFRDLLEPGSWRPRPDFLERAIRRNVEESRRLLRSAHDFALGVYRASGNFDELPEGIAQDVANILSERQPLVLITPYHDPHRILQTLSIAYPDENGRLPLERRLLGRGLARPLPRPAITVSSLLRHFFYLKDPGQNFPLADEVFSAVPIVEGDLAELKLYARDPRVRVPWGWLLRRLIIGRGLTRLGPRQNPIGIDVESFPLLDTFLRNWSRCNEAGDVRSRRAVRTAFLEAQLKRHPFERLWVSRIFLEAVGEVSARAYRSQFGFDKEHGEPFEDPDVTGKQVHILWTERKDFEDKAMDPSRWYAADDPLADAQLRRSPFGNPFEDPVDCSIVLHAVDQMVDTSDMHYPQFFFGGRPRGG